MIVSVFTCLLPEQLLVTSGNSYGQNIEGKTDFEVRKFLTETVFCPVSEKIEMSFLRQHVVRFFLSDFRPLC